MTEKTRFAISWAFLLVSVPLFFLWDPGWAFSIGAGGYLIPRRRDFGGLDRKTKEPKYRKPMFVYACYLLIFSGAYLILNLRGSLPDMRTHSDWHMRVIVTTLLIPILPWILKNEYDRFRLLFMTGKRNLNEAQND